MTRQASVLRDLKESRVACFFDRQRRKGSQTGQATESRAPIQGPRARPTRDAGQQAGPAAGPAAHRLGAAPGRALAGSCAEGRPSLSPGLGGGPAAPQPAGVCGRGCRGRVAAVPPAEPVSRRAPRPPGPAGLGRRRRTLTRHGQQGPRAPPPSGLQPGLSAKAPPGGAGRGCMPAAVLLPVLRARRSPPTVTRSARRPRSGSGPALAELRPRPAPPRRPGGPAEPSRAAPPRARGAPSLGADLTRLSSRSRGVGLGPGRPGSGGAEGCRARRGGPRGLHRVCVCARARHLVASNSATP